MCGRFKLEPGPAVDAILEHLRVDPARILFSPDFSPASQVSIIHGAERRVDTATWWFLLDPHTLKPGRLTSFNSRSDKLNEKRSSWYKPYRHSRCIIPASAFIEGLGDSKTYHMIELVDDAIAFGGLCKEWLNKETGETKWSASIITLGACAGWEAIHPDSMPLMLDYRNEDLIERWLDPEFDAVDAFEPYLKPHVRQAQRITPIGKVSKWNPIGGSVVLPGESI